MRANRQPLTANRTPIAMQFTILHRLWNDEQGATHSIELILIATIIVIGMIVGLATFRNSVVQELGDSAMAIGVVDQSYEYETDLDLVTGGVQNTNTFTFDSAAVTVTIGDSSYTDERDFCEPATPDVAGEGPGCLEFDIAAVEAIEEGTTLTVTP